MIAAGLTASGQIQPTPRDANGLWKRILIGDKNTTVSA